MATRTQNAFAVFLVGILTSAGFGILLWSRFFADPDSFYHIGVARLLLERGVPQTFPWLTYTPLALAYTDQHFLYHVLLLPFVSFLDPLVGGKVATVVINGALMAFLSAFFIRFRVRMWPIFIAILLVTNPWLFRMGLVKAPGLSILLLVLGLWFLFTHRVRLLAVLSFVYVWTYGGFILLGIFAFLYGVVTAIVQWQRHHLLVRIFRTFRLWRMSHIRFWKTTPVKMVLAVAFGLAAGIVINPFFPQNLHFYWQQLIQIGVVNFQNVVNVGGEWRPYHFIDLCANTVFVSIAVLLATVVAVWNRKRLTAETITLFFLALFFFLITLKSRRYVELYVPFAVIYAAFVIRDCAPGTTIRGLWQRFTAIFYRRTILTTLLTLYLVAASCTVIVRDLRQLNIDLKSGFKSTYLSGASVWLANNTPDQSIVVHSDWDEFPILFYFNRHNRYIVGLDPTFMYQDNKVRYQRWADLTSGNRDVDATSIIQRDLASQYVLVAKDHAAFDAVMKRQPLFTKMYEDADATIYAATSSLPTFEPAPVTSNGQLLQK